MKKNNNMRTFFGKLMIAFAVCACIESCTHEELDNNSSKYGASISFGISGTGPKTKSAAKAKNAESIICTYNEPNSIGITVSAIDGIEKTIEPAQLQTKGTQLNSLSRFGVAAYYFSEDKNGSKFFTDTVNDGTNTNDQTYMWPSSGTLNFIASQPAKLIKQFGATETGNYTFNYTIPADVKEQQDVMFATANGLNNSETGDPVGLAFQHLLAAVQFKVGDMQFIQINSLKISGVLGGDIKFTYDNATNVWTPDLSSASSTSYSFIHDEANPSLSSLPSTSGLAKGAAITGNDYNTMLLVAPQTLTDAAQIEVNYTETITGLNNTKSASLAGGEWKAGMTTVYALNISGTDFGTVVIPRPDDQDAHYIMLTMEYNMGNILNRSEIKSVKATAKWKDDAVNTSTKTGISLKFASELSETQKQGFWTDKRYKQTITVTSSGSTPSEITEDKTVDSHGNTGLRGGDYLNVKDATGSIVLFIEENNGTTDREGELIFTATLTTGKEIVLGEGSFKQLCPSWNEKGIGVERIEDSNSSTGYPYGFSYDRKVTYENSGFYIGVGLIRAYYSYILESRITDDAGGFVTITPGESYYLTWKIQKVVLDYSALNSVSAKASSTDGLINTVGLYNFTGGNDISQMENDLDQYNGEYLTKTINSSGSVTPEDYAAYIALSRNRMYELEITITSSEGSEIVPKAVLYKDGTTDIVEWYLPSSEEAKDLKETGVDCDGNNSVIDDLNGRYWSSTAGTDVAPAQANTFVFDANVYSSQNSGPKARTDKYKVRAVRKKPTAN